MSILLLMPWPQVGPFPDLKMKEPLVLLRAQLIFLYSSAIQQQANDEPSPLTPALVVVQYCSYCCRKLVHLYLALVQVTA